MKEENTPVASLSEKPLCASSLLFWFGAGILGVLSCALFVPPVRDKVFSTKLWPWPLPWDTTRAELDELIALSRPGDVILESNLHGWQWVCLCFVTTGTNWVHAAIVDENKKLMTVETKAIETDFDIYLRWGSTRLALIRPPYRDADQISKALDFARSKLGTKYDASFTDHAGNCNGLVGSSLEHCGISVSRIRRFGKTLYAPDCFLKIPGVKVIWRSN